MSRISNKVFCALPFTYVYVDSLNEYKICSDARLSSGINTNDMSILKYFNSDYLNEIAIKEEIQVQKILQSPIKNLVKEHFSN